MNTKICTSIDQSKKLIELGIDVNTADMCYPRDAFDYLYDAEPVCHSCGGIGLALPAWSLSALLGLLPLLYEDNNPSDRGCQPNLCKGWDNNQWHIVYRSAIYITEWYDDPIDAAFELVCWLLKENKL